jgi:hypothetical protein
VNPSHNHKLSDRARCVRIALLYLFTAIVWALVLIMLAVLSGALP